MMRLPKIKVQVWQLDKFSSYIAFASVSLEESFWTSLTPAFYTSLAWAASYSQIEENCDLCSARSDGSWHEKFGNSINSKLNEPQTQTFLACLRKMHCSHKTEVVLIHMTPLFLDKNYTHLIGI
ncbi:uncharacterized protein LOC122315597 [Carya illinoinensis]|uniref:uncharacterized protein LOC122315597 n=1 Tax=Carya illinoinensis TaxID=32201 RepID=UPI001C720A8B|nr:uncharacterized protein LOC122315597 [Carya illinoinensis]